MTTKPALLPSGNPRSRPPVAGAPSTAPQFTLWEDVLVRCIKEDSLDSEPEFFWHPAKVVGIAWEHEHQFWGVTLFYPTRPCSWLPDNWFDSQPTPIDEIQLVNPPF